MSEHTRGEWQTTKYCGGEFGIYAEGDNSHRDIALVRDHGDDTAANAALMAAAPELLAALRRVLDQWHTLRIVGPTVYADAEAAIAKATEYGEYAPTEAPELVAEGDECPECGENRMDNLTWLNDEDDVIVCATCETVYAIGRISEPAEVGA